MTPGKHTKVVATVTLAALLGAIGVAIARDGSGACGMKGNERVRTESGRAHTERSSRDDVTTNAGTGIVRRSSDLIVVIDPASERHHLARTF